MGSEKTFSNHLQPIFQMWKSLQKKIFQSHGSLFMNVFFPVFDHIIENKIPLRYKTDRSSETNR